MTFHFIVVVAMLLILSQGCCQLGSKDYDIARAKVEILVKRGMWDRDGYIKGGWFKPISETDVTLLVTIPHYRKALSELLMEYCGSGGIDDDYTGDLSAFVHVCELMAATGDKFFVDVLKKVGSQPGCMAQVSAAYRAIQALQGKEEPKNEKDE
jgi:hypothetical protein